MTTPNQPIEGQALQSIEARLQATEAYDAIWAMSRNI